MVSFKMFAGTDIGLRNNNEDNFTVCPDLTKNEWIVPADQQQAIPLGKWGCVMAVADGMGGQNAGEVASAIAIATVQEMFSPDVLPANVLDTSGSIKSYLKKVISEADVRVKEHARKNPDTEGMGSTIVITWLVGGTLYVAWLGDSRAYLINKRDISRLSKDHSYVQQLVDAKELTDEAAMNDPNSNIITRSLGDTTQKAKADVKEYSVENGSIVLLCSDGLCGVCKDKEIYGIVEDEAADLMICKDHLTQAALEAGGSDNITIALMQVFCDGTESIKNDSCKSRFWQIFNLKNIFFLLLASVLLSGLLFAGYSMFMQEVPKKDGAPKDTVDADASEITDTSSVDTASVSSSVEHTVESKDIIENVIGCDTTGENNMNLSPEKNQPTINLIKEKQKR